MKVLSFSEIGCIRKNNQDALLALDTEEVYAVADGMGGHLAGEVAARIALEQLTSKAAEINTLTDDQIENWLKNAFYQANLQVFQTANNNPENEGMGTTLSAVVLRKQKVILGHVGDSRVYLWRGNRLQALTEDHSLVAELLKLGQITPVEAEKHPRRNVLVRAIGAAKGVEVDIDTYEHQADDCYFLFTDGVFNVVRESMIAEIFLMNTSWEERLEILKQKIFERGAPDNFTGLFLIAE